MRSLVYHSLPLATVDGALMLDLIRSTERRNAAEGLTGVLFLDPTSFVQWLSGPAPALRRLLDALEADPRHAIAWTCDLDAHGLTAPPHLPMGYLSAADFRGPDAAAALAALRGAAREDAPALSRRLAAVSAVKYPTRYAAATRAFAA